MKTKSVEKTKPTHTILPWHPYYQKYADNDNAPIHTVQIRDAQYGILAVTARYGEHAGCPLDSNTIKANGDFIIKSANNHYALRKALKKAITIIENKYPKHQHKELGIPELKKVLKLSK